MSRLQQRALLKGLRNCNLGDRDLGKNQKSASGEKESGAYKGRYYKVVKVVW